MSDTNLHDLRDAADASVDAVASSTLGFDYEPRLAPGHTTVAGFLLDTLRRRPAGRAVVSLLTFVLFAAGSGMFAYPFFTDIYTEQLVQGRLSDEFTRIQAGSVEDWEASVRGQSGAPLTRIIMPAIDVDTMVVSGTSPAALRAGAGHYPNTPLPGQVGNVAIAGHRTTYGRPFSRTDELRVGDEIWLLTPVGDHLYRVVDPPIDGDCVQYTETEGSAACITHPRDWSVVAPSTQSLLTLTTCHPKGSAAQRLIIRAALVESHEAGWYQTHAQQARDAA